MPFVSYSAETKLIYVRRILAGDRLDDINESMFQSPRRDTVGAWVHLFETTAQVVANPDWYNPRGAPRILAHDERQFLAEVIEEDPTLYLDEIASKLSEARGILISSSALSVEIRDRLQLTLKVARTVDPSQDEEERNQFIFDMEDVPNESIVCFDESHIDGAAVYRPRARAFRGSRTVRLPRPTRSHRHTLLAAMSLEGAVAAQAVNFNVDRDTVEDFLETELLPMMSPYPAPNGLLLLDNASVHLGGNIQHLCDDHGVRLQYLPRYSPDYNPIEKGFGLIKSRFRREHTLDWQHGLTAPEVAESIFTTTFDVLTPEVAYSLFQGSIYI